MKRQKQWSPAQVKRLEAKLNRMAADPKWRYKVQVLGETRRAKWRRHARRLKGRAQTQLYWWWGQWQGSRGR